MSMMFSVIIPLYNKAEFVLQTVESVLAQSFTDFELLVIDDGSTDGGAELLEKAVADPRLQLIRQPNMGDAGSWARNNGMVQAQGEWFAFLDADDIWLPNHLEELAAIAHHIGGPALISTRPIELTVGVKPRPDLRPHSNIHECNYFREAGRRIGLNNSSSSAIHRKIFMKLGGFINVPSGEDLEYWARAALEYPFVLSDRVTSVYYRGTMGVTERLGQGTINAPPPERLRDVSPTLAMLTAKAEQDPALFQREDIRAYVNGRLHNAMRTCIRRALPGRTRALRRLMIEPVHGQTQMLTLLAYLPTPVLEMLNASYSVLAKARKSPWVKTLRHRK